MSGVTTSFARALAGAVAMFVAACAGDGETGSAEATTAQDGHETGDRAEAGDGEGHGREDEISGGEPGHGDEGPGESDHGDHEPRRIALSPDAIERSGIRSEELERGSLAQHVQVTATIEHDVAQVAHIAPLATGQIAEVRASLGDAVASGDVVAVLHSVELGKARAAVAEASASLEVARQNYERQERLRDKGIASERALVESRGAFRRAQARHEAARARLRTFGASGGQGPRYPLRSKIDGTIIEQHASVGETKGPQDELFVVADQSRVWVIGDVPESDVHKVSRGMDALVTLSAYPDRSWSGQVDWIASTVDPESRLLPVRVELENPEGLLRPGLFGTLHLQPSSAAGDYPLAPVDSVQRIDDQPAVFVPEAEGAFRAASIELGVEKGGLVEITSGLGDAQRIVTSGAFDLKAALTAEGRSAEHHH